jgi:hypothetical protein
MRGNCSWYSAKWALTLVPHTIGVIQALLLLELRVALAHCCGAVHAGSLQLCLIGLMSEPVESMIHQFCKHHIKCAVMCVSVHDLHHPQWELRSN